MQLGNGAANALINKRVPVITVFIGDLRQCILQGLVAFLPLTVCLGTVAIQCSVFTLEFIHYMIDHLV